MLSFQKFGPAKRSGATMVLLHGWGGEWKSWFPVIERFKKTHRVFVPDLPGFGDTALQHALTLDEYADEVLKWLHAENLNKNVILVGHSFGGALAALIAAKEPDLVKKLVLVDASGIRPAASASQKVLTAFVSSGRRVLQLPVLSRAFPVLRKMLYSFGPLKNSDYRALNDRAWKETFVNVVSRDISNELVHIQCPTLLVWGELDKDAPLWQGQRMQALIPESNLVVFEGVEHFPYLDKTDRFEEVVREFLK
jgi:pimeloyl-ACP methyl ester carboxylesterase